MKRKMEAYVGFRLDEKLYEKLLLCLDKEDVSMSDCLRSLVFSYCESEEMKLHKALETEKESREIKADERNTLYHELINEINRIGVNINQITARINAGVILAVDSVKLQQYMDQLYETVKQIQK